VCTVIVARLSGDEGSRNSTPPAAAGSTATG